MQSIAVWPPTIPQVAHIILGRLLVDGQVRSFQETGETEKDGLGIIQVLAQRFQRQSLRNESKWESVLFVAERARDFLEEHFVRTMIVDLGADARRFFLQTKLGGGIEHASNPIFR